jgi:hypothetical protein
MTKHFTYLKQLLKSIKNLIFYIIPKKIILNTKNSIEGILILLNYIELKEKITIQLASLIRFTHGIKYTRTK